MTINQSELMNCPFCDVKPTVWRHTQRLEPHGQIWTDVYAAGCYNFACKVSPKSKTYPTIKEAAEAWNRRPTPTIAGDRGEAFQWVTNNKKAIIPLLSDPKISDESRKIYQHCLSVYETLLSALSTPPETIPADDLKTVSLWKPISEWDDGGYVLWDTTGSWGPNTYSIEFSRDKPERKWQGVSADYSDPILFISIDDFDAVARSIIERVGKQA